MGDQDQHPGELSRREFMRLMGAASASPFLAELDEMRRKIDGLAKPIPEDDGTKERPARNEVEKMYFEIRHSRENVDRFFKGIPELDELVTLPEQVYEDPIAQVIIFRPALERAMLYELEKTASQYILDLENQHKMDKATYKEVNALFWKLRDAVESKFTGMNSVYPLMDPSLQTSFMFQEVVSRWSNWEGIKFRETKNEQQSIFGEALSDILKDYPVPGNVKDKHPSEDFATTNLFGNITTNVEFLLAVMESLNDGKPLTQEQKETAMKAVICHELCHALDVCVNANLIGFLDKGDLQKLYILRLKAFSAINTLEQLSSSYEHPEERVSGIDQMLVVLAQGKTITNTEKLRGSATGYSLDRIEEYLYGPRNSTGIQLFFEQAFPDVHLPITEYLTGDWKKHVTRDDYNAQAYDLLDFVLTTYNKDIRTEVSHAEDFGGKMIEYNGSLMLKDDASLPILAKSLSNKVVIALFSGDYQGEVPTVLMRSLCIGVPVTADAEYLAEICGAELLLNQSGATSKDAQKMLQELGKINPYHAYLAKVLVALGDQEVSAIFDEVVAQVSTAYQVAMASRADTSVVI